MSNSRNGICTEKGIRCQALLRGAKCTGHQLIFHVSLRGPSPSEYEDSCDFTTTLFKIQDRPSVEDDSKGMSNSKRSDTNNIRINTELEDDCFCFSPELLSTNNGLSR